MTYVKASGSAVNLIADVALASGLDPKGLLDAGDDIFEAVLHRLAKSQQEQERDTTRDALRQKLNAMKG